MKISGARRCLIINTPSRAVTLYRPFLTDRDLETEIYKELELSWLYFLYSDLLKNAPGLFKELEHSWSHPATRAEGGTQGTPLYIYRVGVLVISS